MIKFRILLLNKEGMEQSQNGLDCRDDRFNFISNALINPNAIEMIYPSLVPRLGRACCVMETNNGTYTIMQPMEEVEQMLVIAKVVILQ